MVKGNLTTTTDMSEYKRPLTHTPTNNNLPILEVLEQAGLCYSIKNEKLEYTHVSSSFLSAFGSKELPRTDFDVFIPEIAYELNHEDTLVLTSQCATEQDRIVISNSGTEMVTCISRSVVNHQGTDLLVTLYKDITEQIQEKQFEAYKKMLTESEVYEKVLNRFSGIIFNSNDRRVIFEGVGRLIVETLKLEDISIFLTDEKNAVLKQVLVVEPKKEPRYSAAGDLSKPIPIDEGIVGKAARIKKTISIGDVTLDENYIPDSIAAKSEIAVPIIYKNMVLGVLDSESSEYNNYTDRTKKVLESVASLLAIKLNELKNFNSIQVKNMQLHSLLRSNPGCVAMLDKDANYVEVSERWEEQFVRGNKEIRGLNHFEENPNLPLRWKNKIIKSLNGQEICVREDSIRRKSGKIEFYKGRVNPWYEADGTVGGVIILAENITGQKEKERQLLRSSKGLSEARKLGKLFSWEAHLDTGLFHWDTDNVNNPFKETSKDIGVDTVLQYIDQEYHADFNLAIEKALNEKGSFSIVHPFVVGDAKYWFHNRGEVVVSQGKVQKVIGTAKDITSQIDAEQAYKLQNLELKKINRELDQFVYKTAHDLRAPLTNLIGLIGLMRSEESPQVLNSYFDLQEKSIEKLDKFIKQITTYTKNARLDVQAKKVNVRNLIDDVLKDHYFVENSEKIEKIVHVEKDLVFYTDAERLQIILNNLVSNAIKFCDLKKQKPTIEITVASIPNKVHICIKDNGVGVASEQQSKIFDMFYRAHKRADGSGIGLYILKETLGRLNGQVILNSKEGEFTQFDVFLPNLKQTKTSLNK